MASFSYKSNIFTAWYQNKSLTTNIVTSTLKNKTKQKSQLLCPSFIYSICTELILPWETNRIIDTNWTLKQIVIFMP